MVDMKGLMTAANTLHKAMNGKKFKLVYFNWLSYL